MAERTRQKLNLAPSDQLERWTLLSSILVWVGVFIFGIGLVVTLRNQRNERLAYASLTATPNPTTTATATATPIPTEKTQLYPKGWSTATPTPVAPPPTHTPRASTTDVQETTNAKDGSTGDGDGDASRPIEYRAPRLGVTPKAPPPPADPPDRLVIPQIELDSPIIPIGWTSVEQDGIRTRVWEVADHAVGWHKTSSHPGQAGNIVLNGHHNIKGEVFRYLVDLEVGDQMYVHAKDQQYTFAVTEKHILKEKGEPLEVRRENAKWIEPTVDERLTIITCWPYTNNTHRLVVVGKPVPTRSLEGLVE
jgi:sortase A